jgi:RHH-type proline utilization regulon transcriptional repressor/proline dehydrogenase/delta 1-pyrroline-5-carboxylate dehydrogenase
VQEDVADRLIEMLLGAMAEWRIGSPDRLAVDVGPVIDAEALAGIERHVEALRAKGRRVHQLGACDPAALRRGTFMLPTVIELDHLSELTREVFGPVLHVLRYQREDLDALLAQINATGYGLTMGLHTRIDETIDRVLKAAHAGNVYVNRNIVGAVVGVQPFGGEGLSGTGPKAGGPLYLYRLLSRRPADVMARLFEPGGPLDLGPFAARMPPALRSLHGWALQQAKPQLAQACTRLHQRSRSGASQTLPGPTGEKNVYALAAREAVLCLAGDDDDRLLQLAAVLAVSGRCVWPVDCEALLRKLPAQVQASVVLARDWGSAEVSFDAVLFHGATPELQAVRRRLAERPGPIVGIERLQSGDVDVPLERLVVEKATSINTAAAGGNATLMTIG